MKIIYKRITVFFSILISINAIGQANLQVGPGTITSGNYIATSTVYTANPPPPNTTLTPTAGLIHLFISNPITNTTTYSSNANPTSPISGNVNTSLPVGKTQSSYGVDPNGSAYYSVPIEVPPGTNNMVPNLSIVYNSQAENGLLGYGWNLSGIHSITRMGKTIYDSGLFAPIYYTNGDWFALDGDKLLPKVTGTNGENGATYSTEHESFSLATSYTISTSSTSPDYFIVQTKGGLTMEYGNTADSKFTPVGNNLPIYAWYLNKVTDANGNYMTYKYYNNSDGQVFIKEIDYTGNTNLGFSPYNSVVFSYGLRQDPNSIYLSGGQFNSDVILNSITVNCQGNYMKKYNLNYYWDANNNLSLLQSIVEYGTDNSNLNSLQFSYTPDDNYSITSPVTASTYTSYPYASLQTPSPALSFLYNNNPTVRVFAPLDINGDGKKDLVSFDGVPSETGVAYREYIEYPNDQTQSNTNDLTYNPELVPVQWIQWESQLNISPNNNTTEFTSSFYGSFPPCTSSCNSLQYFSEFYPINTFDEGFIGYKLVDFNGDGKEDIAFENTVENTPSASNYDSQKEIDVYPCYFINPSSSTTPTYGPVLQTYEGQATTQDATGLCFIDLNGDKKTDVFNYVFDPFTPEALNTFQLWLDVSKPITSPPNSVVSISGDWNPYYEFGYYDFSNAIPMDLYGDGRTELVNIEGHFLDGTLYGAYYILEYDENTITNTGPSYANRNWYLGNGLVLKFDAYNSNYKNTSYSDGHGTTLYTGVSYQPGKGFGNTLVYTVGPYYALYGDFNGDGIADVIQWNQLDGSTWKMYLGDGTGSYPAPGSGIDITSLGLGDPFNYSPYTFPNNTYPYIYYYAVDVNGDGKDDILQFIVNTTNITTAINVYYSTGAGFTAPTTYTIINDTINPGFDQISFGDFNGDGVNDLFYVNGVSSASKPNIFYFYKGAQSRRMKEAVDGYDNKATFYYQPLSADGNTIYSNALLGDFSYPVMDYDGPMYVTDMLTTADGTGNMASPGDTASTTYSYRDLLINEWGKGTIGFLGFNTSNLVANISTITTYTYDPTYYDITNEQVNNNIPNTSTVQISEETYTNTITPTLGTIGNLSELETEQYIDYLSGGDSTTSYTYDANGNLTDKYTTISNIANNVTLETHDFAWSTFVQSGAWLPTKPATYIATMNRPLAPSSYQRTTYYAWGNGNLLETTLDPTTSKIVWIQNLYNNTGAITEQQTSALDVNCPVITNKYSYDVLSRFVTNKYNSLNQDTIITYDPKWGKPLTIKDPDNLTTTYTYDTYGRPLTITTPDNITDYISYNWVMPGELPSGGNDPFDISSTSLYSIYDQRAGSPSLRIYHDWFDRETSTIKDGFSNPLYTETSYDAKGNEYRTSNTYQKIPVYFNPGTYDPIVEAKYHDEYNRLFLIHDTDYNSPTSSGYQLLTTSLEYPYSAGLTTVITKNPDNSISSKTADQTGLLTNSSDYMASSISPYLPTLYSSLDYTYYSNRLPSQISLNGNVVNTFQYDIFARKTYFSDVNYVGDYSYSYDAYNQVVAQTDPNGNSYNSIKYDVLGRLVSKYSTLEAGTYNYTYVSSGNGLNMLQEATAPNGNAITYTYDYLRRPLTINENGLTTTYTYDMYSNIHTKTYPGSGFSITNTYTSAGYLTQTNNTGTGSLIWQAVYMDPFGNYIAYNLGNGVETQKTYTPYGYLTGISAGTVQNMTFNFEPTNGNLNSRIDNIAGLTENFSYDNDPSSRLIEAITYTYTPPSTPTVDITVSYDAFGNIINKLDICAPSTTYTDEIASDGNSNNQVAFVPNSNSIIVPPQSVTYTSFNKASSIMGGASSAYTYTCTYGADDSRVETVLNNDAIGGGTTTRTYAQDYENTLIIGSYVSATEVNYINCGGDLVGMYVNQSGTAAGGDMYYVYTDHLGSILTVTDGTVANTYAQSFDAWGNYRNPADGTNNNIPVVPTWLYRGFTGHEHLPEFQLINMNGRLYDPTISSMLSADPKIKDLSNTQNYNRYSYCLNNPLKYTDPTGYAATSDFYDQNGNFLFHVDDGSNAVFKQTGSGNKAHYVFVGFDPSQGGANVITMDVVRSYLWAQKKLNNTTWDNSTNNRISGLDSRMQQSTIDFINAVQSILGVDLRITQGYRTFSEQDALYAQGRSEPGRIVTHARGGESFHNFGLAIDVVIMNGGQPDWNTQISGLIEELGKGLGFEWGGDWSAGKKDYPHFQMPFGQTLQQLNTQHQQGILGN